jgi:hypothetical protein
METKNMLRRQSGSGDSRGHETMISVSHVTGAEWQVTVKQSATSQ